MDLRYIGSGGDGFTKGRTYCAVGWTNVNGVPAAVVVNDDGLPAFTPMATHWKGAWELAEKSAAKAEKTGKG